MRGTRPAAELVEPVFVRRRNPFRDRKLFLRVPSATLPPGDDGHRVAFVYGEQHPVSIRSLRRYEVGAMLKATVLLSFACLASSAVAAEGPRCASLEKTQKVAGKDTAIAPLTQAPEKLRKSVNFIAGTVGREGFSQRLGAEHPALDRCVAAFDPCGVHEAGVTADERAARKSELRQSLGAAVVDRAGAIAQSLAAFEV